jgi:RNA polymerase sigma-70 factor (ECF subfamily)
MESTAILRKPIPMNIDARARTDEELMEQVKKGDRASFSELVTRHTNKFYGLAYRMLASREEAEDTVQESFLMLWASPEKWDSGRKAKFTTWFYRVVANACLDRKRKARGVTPGEDFDPPDTGMGTEQILENRNKREDMERHIAELPDSQQTALTLCFYEGVSNREAAEIMGLSVKALESLLMRAKATLRTRVRKNTGTEEALNG